MARFRKRYSHGHVRDSGAARSDLAAPMVLSDMGDTLSHADGRTYSSRKHWRDHLKAHGMVELGDQKPGSQEQAPSITEADIAQAYQQCEQGGGVKAREGPPEPWQGNPVDIAAGE